MGKATPTNAREYARGHERWVLIEVDDDEQVHFQAGGMKYSDVYDLLLESAMEVGYKLGKR